MSAGAFVGRDVTLGHDKDIVSSQETRLHEEAELVEAQWRRNKRQVLGPKTLDR
jgi:hypothetical protein